MKMGGTQDVLNLYLNTQLFIHLTVEGIFETLPLIYPPGDTFPGSASIILLLRTT
jgi:hypothetical protein